MFRSSKYIQSCQVKDIGVIELRLGMEVEVAVASSVFEELWCLNHREVDVVGDFSRFIILSSGRILELESRRHGFDFSEQVQCYNLVSVVDSTADSVHVIK